MTKNKSSTFFVNSIEHNLPTTVWIKILENLSYAELITILKNPLLNHKNIISRGLVDNFMNLFFNADVPISVVRKHQRHLIGYVLKILFAKDDAPSLYYQLLAISIPNPLYVNLFFHLFNTDKELKAYLEKYIVTKVNRLDLPSAYRQIFRQALCTFHGINLDLDKFLEESLNSCIYGNVNYLHNLENIQFIPNINHFLPYFYHFTVNTRGIYGINMHELFTIRAQGQPYLKKAVENSNFFSSSLLTILFSTFLADKDKIYSSEDDYISLNKITNFLFNLEYIEKVAGALYKINSIRNTKNENLADINFNIESTNKQMEFYCTYDTEKLKLRGKIDISEVLQLTGKKWPESPTSQDFKDISIGIFFFLLKFTIKGSPEFENYILKIFELHPKTVAILYPVASRYMLNRFYCKHEDSQYERILQIISLNKIKAIPNEQVYSFYNHILFIISQDFPYADPYQVIVRRLKFMLKCLPGLVSIIGRLQKEDIIVVWELIWKVLNNKTLSLSLVKENSNEYAAFKVINRMLEVGGNTGRIGFNGEKVPVNSLKGIILYLEPIIFDIIEHLAPYQLQELFAYFYEQRLDIFNLQHKNGFIKDLITKISQCLDEKFSSNIFEDSVNTLNSEKPFFSENILADYNFAMLVIQSLSYKINFLQFQKILYLLQNPQFIFKTPLLKTLSECIIGLRQKNVISISEYNYTYSVFLGCIEVLSESSENNNKFEAVIRILCSYHRVLGQKDLQQVFDNYLDDLNKRLDVNFIDNFHHDFVWLYVILTCILDILTYNKANIVINADLISRCYEFLEIKSELPNAYIGKLAREVLLSMLQLRDKITQNRVDFFRNSTAEANNVVESALESSCNDSYTPVFRSDSSRTSLFTASFEKNVVEQAPLATNLSYFRK